MPIKKVNMSVPADVRASLRKAGIAFVLTGPAAVLASQEAKHLMELGFDPIQAASLTGLATELNCLVFTWLWCSVLVLVRNRRPVELPRRPKTWRESLLLFGRGGTGYLLGVLAQLGTVEGVHRGVGSGVVVCASSLGVVVSAVFDAVFRGEGHKRIRVAVVGCSLVCVGGVALVCMDTILQSNLWGVPIPVGIGLFASLVYPISTGLSNRLNGANGFNQPTVMTLMYIGFIATGLNLAVLAAHPPHLSLLAHLGWGEYGKLAGSGALLTLPAFVLQAASRTKQGRANRTLLQVLSTLQIVSAFLVEAGLFHGTFSWWTVGGCVVIVAMVYLIVGQLLPRVHPETPESQEAEMPAGIGSDDQVTRGLP